MNAPKPATTKRFLDLIGDRLDRSPLAVLLDVDGTLAPIAPRPTDARVPAATRDIVARLARKPGVTVALVSGRSADDAWRLAGVPGAWVIGNHGFEVRHPDGVVEPHQDVRGFDTAIASAVQQLQMDAGRIRGVIVENKRWTLSVHYRLVEDREVAGVVRRVHEVGETLGLRALSGKRIVELRPPVEVNKGSASLALLEHIGIAAGNGAAMYAGDDVTDEDAFRSLRQRLPRTVTVRVASSEDPERPTSEAEFHLGSLEELRELLEWLVRRRTDTTDVAGRVAL